MNWFGNQKGEGVEYFLLILGLAGSLVFSGGGKFSIDLWLARPKKISSDISLSITGEDAILA